MVLKGLVFFLSFFLPFIFVGWLYAENKPFKNQKDLDVFLCSRWLQFVQVTDRVIRVGEVDGPVSDVGHVSFEVKNNHTQIEFRYMLVHPKFRKMGVSHALLNQVFLKYPSVTEIEGGFLGVNEEVVAVALKSGLKPLDAIRLSPFYRVISKFGFVLDPNRTVIKRGVDVFATKTGNFPKD